MSDDTEREPSASTSPARATGSTSSVEALSEHPELELVGRQRAGRATPPARSPAATSTRSSTPPARLAAGGRDGRDPRAHAHAGRRSLASGEASALLEEALDADVADVLLLPQLTENVVFAIAQGRARAAGGAAGAHRASTAASSPCSRRRAAPARP